MNPEDKQLVLNALVKYLREKVPSHQQENFCAGILKTTTIFRSPISIKDRFDICREALEILGHRPIQQVNDIGVEVVATDHSLQMKITDQEKIDC